MKTDQPMKTTSSKSPFRSVTHFAFTFGCSAFVLLSTGCSVLTYRTPTGERFTRSSIGSNLAISSLTVSADTNGVRTVNLRGYQNDSTQALGVVTDAAVKAAITSAKP
jgi:hypothetical protein